MKFFYALIVFILATYIYLWGLILVIPTPKIYDKNSFIDSLNLTDKEKQETLPSILETYKANEVGENYYFEQSIDKKRGSAIFLAAIFSFVLIFLFIIIFHEKSHILLPLIAAITLSLVIYSSLWIFNFTLGEQIYLDLQNIRGLYQGIKALQFLGVYISVFLLILLFGSWYGIGQKIVKQNNIIAQ